MNVTVCLKKGDIAVTPGDNDPYGSTENTTAYEGERKPGSTRGYWKSIWAVSLALVFLLLIVGWSLLQPAGPDPAPGGSPANGVVRTPSPAGIKD